MTVSKLAKGVIRISIILLISFLSVEFLMTVLDPYLFKDRFEYDPDLGFRTRAYFPTKSGFWDASHVGSFTNQFGFNDRDYPLAKGPGTFRIVVVGDSYSWAGGREGNYTAVLERMLESRDGSHKIDVINTGYPGTHSGEQLIMLKKFGLQYNPDLVILGFFAGNDFFDADPNRKRIVVNKYFADIDKRYEHRFLGYPIITQSRLLLFLRRKFESYKADELARKEASERAAATGQPAPVMSLPEQTYYNIQGARLEFFNKKSSGERFGANTRYIFESISEMNELLKSRGIKLLVAIYPDELQVSSTHFDSLVAKLHLAREDYDLNLAQDLLKTFLESKQIPYLDMLERFRIEEKQRELYTFRDTHWNNAGNDLAAQILYEYLSRQPFDSNLTK